MRYTIFTKKGMFVIGIIAVIVSLCFVFYCLKDNFVSQKYAGTSFQTNYTKIENSTNKYEKSNLEINDDDFSGIFTYGPYVNLKKGTYILNISYESEKDNNFDVVYNGAESIALNGVLEANENEKEIEFEIENDINDKSFEIRTYYDKGGYFKLNSATIKRNDFNLGGVATGVSFLLLIGIILYLFKDDLKNQYIMSIFSFGNYLLLYNTLVERYEILVIAFLALILWAIGVKKKFLRSLDNIKSFGDVVSLLFTAFLISISIVYFKNPEKVNTINFVKYTSFQEVILYLMGAINVLLLIFLKFENYGRAIVGKLMLTVSIVYGFIIVSNTNNSPYLTFGVMIIIGYIIYYLNKENILNLEDVKISYKEGFIFVSLIAIGFSLFFGLMTCYRYKTFSSSTFDFGIFAQMYEYMVKTGKPLSTCERDMLLSHFCIHISPIYYVLLPFYAIFRTPEALLMMQAIVVFLGYMPVFLICKKYNMKPFLTVLVSILYLVYPAFISPLYFDFHENKFLPVMILWTIYFIENKKIVPFSVFMILTLMIKEDAGLYLIFLALYYMLLRKEFKFSLIMLLTSIAYFIIAFAIIRHLGYSLIDGHYGLYYIGKQNGVLDMAKNIIINPGFFINNVFTKEKFEFMIYALGTLLFIPLLNKDIKNIILIVPFVGVNLMTDYGYQYNIGYQYVYGPCTLLLFLFILKIKDMNEKYKSTVCLVAIIAGVFLTYTEKGESLYNFYTHYEENQEKFEKMEEVIDRIPQDVSISATNWLVPHFYDRDIVYSDNTKNETDYCVYYGAKDEKYLRKVNEIIDKGYILVYDDGVMQVYKTPNAPDMN